jgi:hypothetical protein
MLTVMMVSNLKALAGGAVIGVLLRRYVLYGAMFPIAPAIMLRQLRGREILKGNHAARSVSLWLRKGKQRDE